jgi:hypothetical protein
VTDLDLFISTLKKIGLTYTCRATGGPEGETAFVGFNDTLNQRVVLRFVNGALG